MFSIECDLKTLPGLGFCGVALCAKQKERYTKGWWHCPFAFWWHKGLPQVPAAVHYPQLWPLQGQCSGTEKHQHTSRVRNLDFHGSRTSWGVGSPSAALCSAFSSVDVTLGLMWAINLSWLCVSSAITAPSKLKVSVLKKWAAAGCTSLCCW